MFKFQIVFEHLNEHIEGSFEKWNLKFDCKVSFDLNSASVNQLQDYMQNTIIITMYVCSTCLNMEILKIENSYTLVWGQRFHYLPLGREPLLVGRLSTVDLLVLTSLDQLHFILKILFTF